LDSVGLEGRSCLAFQPPSAQPPLAGSGPFKGSFPPVVGSRRSPSGIQTGSPYPYLTASPEPLHRSSTLSAGAPCSGPVGPFRLSRCSRAFIRLWRRRPVHVPRHFPCGWRLLVLWTPHCGVRQLVFSCQTAATVSAFRRPCRLATAAGRQSHFCHMPDACQPRLALSCGDRPILLGPNRPNPARCPLWGSGGVLWCHP